MNCEEFSQKIDQALADKLSQPELDQFVVHKRMCYSCSAKLADRRIDLMAWYGWICAPWDPPGSPGSRWPKDHPLPQPGDPQYETIEKYIAEHKEKSRR